MICSVYLSLFEFKGLDKFSTFVIPNSFTGKNYYIRLYLSSDFKAIEFTEGNTYRLTLSFTASNAKVPKSRLESNVSFVRGVEEIGTNLNDREFGEFSTIGVITEFLKMPLYDEQDNPTGYCAYRFTCCNSADTKEQYPFYLWDYAKEDEYDAITKADIKNRTIFKFECSVYTKTRWNTDGTTSTAKADLFDNGKPIYDTEVRIRYITDYTKPERKPKVVRLSK